MTPKQPPQPLYEYMTPEEAVKLRALLDNHEKILALVEAASRREWLWARTKYWVIFLAGVYAVATAKFSELMTKIKSTMP